MASSTLARPAGRSRRRHASTTPTRARDLVLVAAAGLGLLVSVYLTFVDLIGGATLCLAGSDCDVVRASAYGHVAGLPVAALGLVYFAVVLGLAVPSAAARPTSWRQRLLETLGGVGIGAAVVFLLIQGVIVRAWCPYCLVADLAALAIGLRVLWSRRDGIPSARLSRAAVGAILAVAILAAGNAVAPPSAAQTSTASFSADRLTALADHLRESGAVFYGASWCPHCQAQKQMFGASAAQLPYVECDPSSTNAHPDLCQAASVRAYPTWVIDGQKIEGEVSPADLARLSGFEG